LGSHAELPEEERSTVVELHVVQLPKLLRNGLGALIYRQLLCHHQADKIPGALVESAAESCFKLLKRRAVKSLVDLQAQLQAEGGEKLIDLLVETCLEKFGVTTASPARPLRASLVRLLHGGDNVEELESGLTTCLKTSDEVLLERLVQQRTRTAAFLSTLRAHAVDCMQWTTMDQADGPAIVDAGADEDNCKENASPSDAE